MRTPFFVNILIAATLLFLSGCSYLPFNSSINMDELPATIRVGLATDTPPLSYRDQSSAMRGLDPLLAAGLKTYSQRDVLYVPLPRKDLLDALKNNQVDVVMAGLTPEATCIQGWFPSCFWISRKN